MRSTSYSCAATSNLNLKRLADHLFTFFPELIGSIWIECICSYSFADGGDNCIVADNISDVAVRAISTADLVGESNDGGPHRSRGSLRDGLPLEGWLALRLKLLVYLIDDGLHTVRIGVTAELRLYASRMHGGSAHAALLVPLVESNGKKEISRLRSTISDERVIGCPLKVGILQINIGVTVTRRSQVNQPASRADKTRNPVNENKVAQMIGPELRLKTSRRLPKGVAMTPALAIMTSKASPLATS